MKAFKFAGLGGAVCAATILFGSSAADASTGALGSISFIFPSMNGAVFFNQSGTRTTAPTCQNSATTTRWVIDATQPGGQAMVATLLTAYSTGKQIVIAGTGLCSIDSQTETVSAFYIQN